MSYEQVRKFYPKEMGRQKGWCLKNARLGYRIYTGKFASAKADMLSQKKNGTLHPMSTLPYNCSVPVYIDSTSQYEHVEVYDHGTWYSDGIKVNAPKYDKCFGWGELCDGTRIVKLANNDKFLPAKGYWCEGDQDKRIGKLSSFMYKNFPAYTSSKALGNYYGKYIKKAITEFQRRTGLYPDGMVGKNTYNKLKEYGFKYGE